MSHDSFFDSGSNVPRSTDTTITPGELSSQDGDSIENVIYCDGYLNWLDRSIVG